MNAASAPELAGLVALVTGSSRGIGAAIAERFAAAGAEVVLVARSEDALATVARRIADAGGRARTIAADLADPSAVAQIAQAAGPIDVLVNNAAVGQRFESFTAFDDAYWREVLEVGLFAPARLARELARGMAERGRGVVISMSSAAGRQAMPFLGHYCAAKAGMDMVMRSAALELGRKGVRLVSIAPGAIDTKHHDVDHSRRSGMNPLDRVGLPSEVAELALFLASDRAAFITGEIVSCDGGLNAGYSGHYELLKPYVRSPGG